MQGCGMGVIKYLLFFFNLLFSIAGAGLIIAGGLVLHQANYSLIETDSRGPAIALIVIGVFIFVTAFLGCCGAIKESDCMLITFAAILVVIFIAQLAIGITAAVYKDNFKEELKKQMTDSIDKFSSEEYVRQAWNQVQKDFECCGVDSKADWKKILPTEVPASCCPHPSGNSAEELCAESRVVNTKGCYEPVKTLVRDGLHALMAVALTIAFVELLGAFLACMLAHRIRKETTEVA